MAHSWVQSFPSEDEAFRAFARTYPGRTTLLVDTQDIAQGVERAARLDPPPRAIRIDSGDPLEESRRARAILDRAGRAGVQIVASGDLEEREIDRLVRAGAPIDTFGVGTELITVRDAPGLGMVYKLAELDGRPRFKTSPGKRTYPWAKQVYRSADAQGRWTGDRVVHVDEAVPGAEPLLRLMLRDGERVEPGAGLEATRAAIAASRRAIPAELLELDAGGIYPVEFSDRLTSLPGG